MSVRRSAVPAVCFALTIAVGACASDASSPSTTIAVGTTTSAVPSAPAGPTTTIDASSPVIPVTIPIGTAPTGPDPTVVGGAPAPTADPSAPPQVGPIDPGMTMSSDTVITALTLPTTTTTFAP